MSMRHVYLLVEGAQEVHFISRLLSQLGFKRAERLEVVPEKWWRFAEQGTIERHRSLSEKGRPGVPFWKIFKQAFLLSDSRCVVIEPVCGNRDRFGETLRETSSFLDGGLSKLLGVGVIADVDRQAHSTFQSSADALASAGLPRPQELGLVQVGTPRTGIFVLPDNHRTGGLEETLIDCARSVYPSLTKSATSLVEAIDPACVDFTTDDLEGLRRPQGKSKAVVGIISSVLKPGATIQVSLQKDRWICNSTLTVPCIAALSQFLRELCEL